MGKSRARFVQRMQDRITDRSDAYVRGSSEYGCECIYCEKYFPNVKKPSFGGYICSSCKSSMISL